jgi:hypothetical protein
MMRRHARQYRTETHTLRINLSSMLACAAVLMITAGASAVGRAAADTPPPDEAGCAALATAQFAIVTTLTATYEAGSAVQPAHCVVRGSAARRTAARMFHVSADSMVTRPVRNS